MSNGNVLTVQSGPSSIAQFAAAASLVNAAEQFLPPFYGAASALTRFPGALIAGQTPPLGTSGTGEQRVVNSLRIRFTGDVANVAGQTISVKLYKTPAGSATPVLVGETLAGIATTAGLHEGETRFPTAGPVVYEPGDEMTVSITPSAALTAVLTNVSVAAGA